ncbi:MAG: glycosyltransferase [Phycisphaeraceae bacterium]|nr:MAG: glycosyltransferase [Phycisphaeraceae bacterium]
MTSLATDSKQTDTRPSAHPVPAPGTWPTAPVSVVILTLNEEINIAECLASCGWCDDVHVLDSGSTDHTREIAEELGADVHVNPFESFGAQRNWAIDNIPMKHEWIFHLDADERFTPELVEEMRRVIESDPTEAGFDVPHKLIFMGKWLKRSGGYPTYQMRFFHKDRMRFRDYGHGQRENTDGYLGRMKQPYLHYSFSKGLYDWLDKHNRYSSLEALQAIQSGKEPLGLRRLLVKDPVVRRRAWKEISFRIPFRPYVRWFVTMFILGGVLEGRAGWSYIRLLTIYEQMTTLKLRLLRARSRAGAERFEKDDKPKADTKAHDAGDQFFERGAEDVPLGPAAENFEQRAAAAIKVDDSGQLIPESSPWTFREKVIRSVWMLAGRPVFRLSFHNWYGFRAWLLRIFGAKIGSGVRIRPTVNVEIPWNLDIRDGVTVGDFAILYSLGKITIGERTIISQYGHLCAGTHDHTDRRFPLIRDPVTIGSDAWIGADAFVGPNVVVGSLSVLGARSSAYKDLDPATVYVGNPAKALKKRELH